ncbi:E1-like protein-activating [Coniophora puteana RWD-64-598 SS2]|uniref:Ubiquitin-like modifier-activating enzyme ATG7 n=1 Tax=Coniophora puteana (strain RWD-64-598) TaxID=741705 RepID=A0A5M3MAI3_CONPW|nr:E1-like protein-activating [Coniophora puteana RWD-64-598 SS2]EIW75651.1 E1-like protein-activating [Coniophora puteana RWD-64-598 SS2]
MEVVKFVSFSSIVHPGFWHELTRVKIDVLKLSDDTLTIGGSYAPGRSIKDRETGGEIAMPCNFALGEDAFKEVQTANFAIPVQGEFKNYNTIEDFKAAKKKELLNNLSNKIWDSVTKDKDTSMLTRFSLITFADLKKYRYHYWFAFPAFPAEPSWQIAQGGWKAASEESSAKQLSTIHTRLSAKPSAFFLIRPAGDDVEMDMVENYQSFFANVAPEQRTIGFVDPSAQPQNPGWPLRNLLSYLHVHYPTDSSAVRVLCWRDSDVPSAASSGGWKSRFGVVSLPAGATIAGPTKAVGWEKAPARGKDGGVEEKLIPRMADLAPMMDPTRLADQAVDLNLKLMRWRIMPSLDLDKVASTRCLLLGAGTLGCYVARTLMGWGVRTITFVDSARVSFSNPVRQPLFEFADCLEGGKPKAECAANALKKIFPGMNTRGIELSIPMPGHPIEGGKDGKLAQKAKKDVEELEKLFDEHDAVFLLMDSRESRWLPTVLGASKGKIVMNAALGFDTYLVMRHGARASTSKGQRLGCYYCNDIVAPADSLTDRTLDQMCTVTRPGLAPIAASSAVELLVSLLQHPEGLHAPPPPPESSKSQNSEDGANESVLGLVPHQLRGFLAQFRTMPITGAAYDRCTGCSEAVLKAYEERGFDMMLEAFNETGYLERLTGLDKLHSEGDAAFEAVDWDEEDEEGDM